MGIVPVKPLANPKIEYLPTKDGRGMFLISGGKLVPGQLQSFDELRAELFAQRAQQKQAPPQKKHSPKKHRPAPSWPAVGTPSTWRPKKLAELKSEENNDDPNRSVSGASLPERPINPERGD